MAYVGYHLVQNNTYVEDLYLHNNQIGVGGAHYLSITLQHNKKLTVLCLTNNQIGNEGIQYLSDALEDNETLNVVSLGKNHITAEGVYYLSNALQYNKTLTTLYLSDNPFGNKGALYLSNVLQSSTALTTLWINNNHIGIEGAQYLSNALKTNTTLMILFLHNNHIQSQGAQYLSDALQNNKTLKKLNLSDNEIGNKGTQHLCNTFINKKEFKIMALNTKSTTNTPNSIKFLISGLASMGATLFVHPMDLVKNRMQISGEGGGVKEYRTSYHALTTIFRKEGFRGIYSGLSAGLFRQATYATTRLGIYQILLERFRDQDGRPPSIFVNLLLGVVSGGLGSLIGTPAELALIRMTLDGRLPMNERRNYAHVFDALARITREEGILKLWRGAIPTVTRAMIVNAAQMPSYSQAKQLIMSMDLMQQGLPLHAVSSLIAALITTIVSLPIDIVKTRYQNMKIIQGKPEYTGILDVFQRIFRQEGVLSFWKGFTPYFYRIGPHTILSFIFIEQLNIQYQRRICKNESYMSTL
ncbi:unnamed protein product [Adineta steineri]|uniref:Mitochondrial 2-oxoglutarate/malate carrier protein n=1 Tax=Adineta steineri TaxID=433720 RepID=A0A819ABX6_9BILA|nr:unnamed protein product [Adineta steineri]